MRAVTIYNGNRIITGMMFFLKVTLRDEADQQLALAGSLKNQVMLALGYGCGLRTGEFVRLTSEAGSVQNIIRTVQSKGRRSRHVMLPVNISGFLLTAAAGSPQ